MLSQTRTYRNNHDIDMLQLCDGETNEIFSLLLQKCIRFYNVCISFYFLYILHTILFIISE